MTLFQYASIVHRAQIIYSSPCMALFRHTACFGHVRVAGLFLLCLLCAENLGLWSKVDKKNRSQVDWMHVNWQTECFWIHSAAPSWMPSSIKISECVPKAATRARAVTLPSSFLTDELVCLGSRADPFFHHTFHSLLEKFHNFCRILSRYLSINWGCFSCPTCLVSGCYDTNSTAFKTVGLAQNRYMLNTGACSIQVHNINRCTLRTGACSIQMHAQYRCTLSTGACSIQVHG